MRRELWLLLAVLAGVLVFLALSRERAPRSGADPTTSVESFSSTMGKDVPLAEIALHPAQNTCLIDGLPLGLLEVRAHVGDPRSPDLIGSAEAEILGGKTSTVMLYLNPR